MFFGFEKNKGVKSLVNIKTKVMKTRIIFSLIALLIFSGTTLKSQQQPEQLNLPGDNLNLYAVMKIFQESETLEIFEKKLNDQDLRINNLDLNGDNFIDYIKVIDYSEKEVHYITLQVAVTPTENQDVAVFVVKKDPNGKVIIQLIGDEALYGKYYIVEPYYDTDKGATPNPGYNGNNNVSEQVVVHRTTTAEVASWPLVTFIFFPGYIAWHSPYYWDYYPSYWHPWTPWYWHEYYGYHYHMYDDYYGHYHHGDHFRFNNDYYYNHNRATSNVVHERRDRGEYNSSYSNPQSITAGSDYFRKHHPERAATNSREPDLKNIRVAAKADYQNEKIKAQEQNNNRMKNSQPNDRTKMAKPANPKVNSNPANPKMNSNPVRTETRPANVKQGNNERKQGNVNQGKSEYKQENGKQQRTETRQAPPKSEKNQNIRNQQSKPSEKRAPRESRPQRKEETKKDNPKPSRGDEKSDRK